MEFVNPGFLYGLFAISIPVIIHLFNFRRFKKVYFTNVKFIQELKLETQKQSRLKHLLILLMRILAIAAIVIAFAQPFIPLSKNIIKPHEKNAISVYIDNSFSLQAESDKGILLDKVKEKAVELASVYKSSDVFQLLTNDFEGRHQRFVSKDEFIDLVEEVQISPVVKPIQEIVIRQEDIFKSSQSEKKTSYFISDFQKNILSENINIQDTTLNIYFIPMTAVNSDNLFIDSCWFEAPVKQVNQSVRLKVSISNSSGNYYEKIPVKLLINDQQKAVASFDIESYSSTIIELPYTNYETGIQFGLLEIDDYPISFDDKFYFSYYVSAVTPVLCINGNEENVYLNSLFGKDSTFLFRNVSIGSIDYSSFSGNHLIILNELDEISSGLIQEVNRFVDNGGSLIVLPSENVDFLSYNELLKSIKASTFTSLDTANTIVSHINLEHPLFRDVFEEIPENLDLPVVFKYYVLDVIIRSQQESLLKLQNGNVFLNVQDFGKGNIYLFATPLKTGFSNFPRHAIFVPTLYKIAVSSISEDKIYNTIGKDEVIHVNNINLSGDNILRIIDSESGFEFIPETRKVNSHLDIFTHGQISLSGNYTLLNGENSVKGLSYNYNRIESEMTFYTNSELNDIIEEGEIKNLYVLEYGDRPFVQVLTELSQGVKLWKWFVFLTLIFLLAEVILLRFWK